MPPSQPLTVVILTPPGMAAVASLQVEGSSAAQAIDQRFHPAHPTQWLERTSGTIYYGTWLHGEQAKEDLVIIPLDQDRFEIHCHGGTQVVESIVAGLQDSGARRVSPWQWLCNTTKPLIKAEAIWLRSQLSAAAPATLLSGVWDHRLIEATSQWLDLSEPNQKDSAPNDFTKSQDALQTLLRLQDSWRLGQFASRPFRVVLYGPPNVGKSSLINALLGFQRSIVFDQPGTTRDVVGAPTVLRGWPVELFDTAGIRNDALDQLEREGIDRSRNQLEQADLILLVSAPDLPQTTSEGLPPSIAQLRVLNKVDMLTSTDSSTSQPTDAGQQAVSALTGSGLAELLLDIEAFLPPPAQLNQPTLFTTRQRDCVNEAINRLENNDWTAARKAILRLLHGDVSPDTGVTAPQPHWNETTPHLGA